MITTATVPETVEADRFGSAAAPRPGARAMSASRPSLGCGRIAAGRTGGKLLALILGGLVLPLALPAWALNPGDLDTSFSGDGIEVAPSADDGGGGFTDSEGRALVSTAEGRSAILGQSANGWSRIGFEVDSTGTAAGTFDGDSDPDDDGFAENVTGDCGGQYSDAVHSPCAGLCPVGHPGYFFVAGSNSPWDTGCNSGMKRSFVVSLVDASSGRETLTYGNEIEGFEAEAFGIARSSDGDVIAVGTRRSTPSRVALVRLNTQGPLFSTDLTVDTSFGGGDGIITHAIGSGDAYAYEVALQSDGKIVVVGAMGSSHTTANGWPYTNTNAFVARVTETGGLDSSFGTGGVVSWTAAGTDGMVATGVQIASDGDIVVSGKQYITPCGFLCGGQSGFVRRYTPVGVLDSTFGGGDGEVGQWLVPFEDVVLDRLGRITAVGSVYSSNQAAIVRYTADGTLDPTFAGGEPVARFAPVLGFTGMRITSAEMSSDSKTIMVGGTMYASIGTDRLFLARVHGSPVCGDGMLDVGEACDLGDSTDQATRVSTARSHSCAVTTGGGVKCWGANWYGQLGDGTVINRLTPVPVSTLGSGVAAVSAGHYRTCALMTGGGVKCWGSNWDGRLGDGTVINRLTPVPVSTLGSGVAAVSASYRHTCALTTGGGVKCWGSNEYGQLGDGTAIKRLTPVPVSTLGSGAAAVSAGGHHTCALMTGGGVKCWGWNGGGQLGDGTTDQRPTPAYVSSLSESLNGASDNCCTNECQFVAAGTECRAGAGDPNSSGFVCDPAETCGGASRTCPSDVSHAGEICRTGVGDVCDPHETCPEGTGSVCAPDIVETEGTVCSGDSGDSCDPAEVCDGIAGHGCPADVIQPAGTVCRAGSGDLCDPAEACTGVAGEPCPTNAVSLGGTVCRELADVTCDIAERCTGIVGQSCPPDVGWPAATVCRVAVDVCDLTETCGGATTCPADEQKPDADTDTVCDEIDNCALIANLNQADGDSDGVGTVCDNCPDTCNPDQDNADGDAGGGDVCDVCPAIDEAAEPVECATAEYNSELACCRAMSSAGVSVDVDGPSCGAASDVSFQTPPDPDTGTTVTVEIPAGAVDGPTSISVTPMTQGGGDYILSTTVGKFVAGAVMEPAGMSFDPPLLVCMAWQDADNNGRVDNLDFVVEEANIRPTLHDETTSTEIVLGPRCGLQRQCGAIGVDGLPATVPGNLDDGSLRACCSTSANAYCFEVTHFSAYAIADLSCAGEATARIIATRMNQPGGTQGLQVKGGFDLGGPIEGGLDPRATGFELVIQAADGSPLYQVTLPAGAFSRATAEGWKTSARGGKAQWQSKTGIKGVTKVKLEWDDATGRGSFDLKGKNLSLAVEAADLPLQTEVRLDPSALAGRCGLATFAPPAGICALNGSGTTLLCQ